MSVLDNTDTRIMRPSPGRHRASEEVMGAKTKLISPEVRAAVVRPPVPPVPAVQPEPEPEPEPAKPTAYAALVDRIKRNVPSPKRWFRP